MGLNGTKERPIKVRVLKVGIDDEITPTWGKLYSDNSVDWTGKPANRSFILRRQKLNRWPTPWKTLGLSKGTYPAIVVYEEHAYPLDFTHKAEYCTCIRNLKHKADCRFEPIDLSRNGFKIESSRDINEFKNEKLTRNFFRAAQRENNAELIRTGIIVLAIVGIIVVVLLLGIAFKMGMFDLGTWTQTKG